jgi:hypothetical protein
MIASQIVIGVAMAPRGILVMLFVSRIIIQMHKIGYGLGTAIVIYTKAGSQMSCPILLIRFDSYASLALRSEFPTLFSMEKSTPASLTGSQENTQGLTNTTTTPTSALKKKLTMMGLFFKYLC